MNHNDLPLSPEDVAEIAAILDGTAYERLDITTARFRLRVARPEADGADGQGFTQEWAYHEDAPRAEPQAPAASGEVEAGNYVRAPLPGTFYRAPAPGAAPFLEVGAIVTPETIVGIIETMKLMNPVHAGVSGVVEAILVENATMIAKGAALMRLAD